MNTLGAWPALGLGTWRLGESARSRRAEIAAVRAALAMGYRLIDTAGIRRKGKTTEMAEKLSVVMARKALERAVVAAFFQDDAVILGPS